MRKLDNERDQKKQNRQRFLLKTVFLIVFLLLSCQIILANLISASGDRIQLLEQRYVTLSTQNELLKKQIASVTSLTVLSQEAQKLGLVKNNAVIYLENQVNVAMEVN